LAQDIEDMRLLEIAQEQGLIMPSQLQEIRRECLQRGTKGRKANPTRIAIERGILSDEDTRDLETEVWIQDMPSEVDGYQLMRLVGRGGMAVVFEARDVSLGKAVAIKVLLPEFSSSESYLARFQREARIAAKLTHPNTVQVFGAGEVEGLHYLVMEYVEGATVSGIIRDGGKLPERKALEIVIGLCGALEEAAALGIVHRDIKPANILISKWNIAKLADFGIAKEFSDIHDARIQRSLTMGVVGTPTYMSPEQARGMRHLDLRSDMYSLGATFYHMVVGDLPFSANTPQETMVQVVSNAPRPPKAACPELSEATAAIICKMMAKDVENRYQDFSELRADLMAAIEGDEASLDYEDALLLLRPTPVDDEDDEVADDSNLLRIVAVAVAVAALGVILLWVMRACAG